jgi:K+-transporting ATPase A subunit
MSKNQEQLQEIIDSITAFLSFDQFCVTAWQPGLQTKIQLYSGPTSAVLLIPTFPFVAVAAFSSAVLGLAILASFFESLSRAMRELSYPPFYSGTYRWLTRCFKPHCSI